MTRTSTELPRLEPESSASTNSAMAALWLIKSSCQLRLPSVKQKNVTGHKRIFPVNPQSQMLGFLAHYSGGIP